MINAEQRAMNRMTLIYALIGSLCMATIISGVSAFERMLAAQEERHARRAKADELELRFELLRGLAADKKDGRLTLAELEALAGRVGLPPDSSAALFAEARRAADPRGKVDAAAVVRRLAGQVSADGAGADAGETSEVPLYVAAFNLSMLAAALTGFGLLFSRRVRGLLVSYRVAKEEAEAAYAEQERFLAIMSHEMRTPLHVIIGSSDLLETTVDAELRARHIHRIGAASEVLLTLVNDALDLAQSSAKTTPIVPRPVRVADMVRTTIELMRAIADKRGLVLGAEIRADVPELVELDAERVRQVLVNLLGNALKFTEKGNVRLVVQVEAAGARLRFSVEDTGGGIDESRRAELFTPFSPATASRLRNGGSGLGLSISKALVERMGGAIDCANNKKAGSTFWIDLPLVAAEGGKTVTAAVPKDAAGASVRVLVVDDHEDCREVMSQMLTHLGHTVALAAGGEEALALVGSGPAPFDLILVDLQMGAMDGAAMTAAMRARPELAGTPIIGVTATAVASEIDQALKVGMDACISKPLRLGALRKNLPLWLARRGPARSAAAQGVAPEAKDPGLDPEMLSELRTLEEEMPGFLATRLMNFLTDADQTLSDLHAALTASKRPEVRRLAHRFRTSCGIVGATRCGVLAAALEAAAGDKDLAALTADLARLQRAIQQLRPQIDEILAEVQQSSHQSVA